MKPGGKDGKLYKIYEMTTVSGGEGAMIANSGFYRIKSVGENTSLPQPSAAAVSKGARAMAVGDVVHLWSGQRLTQGDEVIALRLKLISFVKDVSNSRQGTSYDVSTQENLDSGVREYITGAFSESSGSINGTVETDSEEQRELMNQFASIAEDEGDGYAIYPAKETKQDYMLSRHETDTIGETAIWEHFPVTVESITMDKPLDGEQNFNFNYKVDGGNHPGVIFYKVREVSAAPSDPSGDPNGGD